MKMRLVISTLAACAVAANAHAQTADEIIAKNLTARGGIEKMRAIRSMVVTARLATPDGGGGPLTVRLLRPNRIREEMTFGAAKSTRAFDGQSAWVQDRENSHEDLRPLTGGDLENLRDEAENGIDGALADYASKGNHVKFEGAAVVEGKTCYKLKVTLRSGHVQFQYLDTQSFLEIHEEIVRTFNGQDTLIEQSVGDYRSEGGILFAHSFVSGLAGRPQRTTLTIEKIELNPPVDKALFQMPKPRESGSAAHQPSFFPAALAARKGCTRSRA
jgi:outer membrane lipoprotein-sorting protein